MIHNHVSKADNDIYTTILRKKYNILWIFEITYVQRFFLHLNDFVS